MAAAMKFSVTIDGIAHEVSIKPGDLVAFERQYPDVNIETMEKNPKVEHVFFMAWRAAKRTGITELDFDAFLDSVDELDPMEEAPLDEPVAS